MLRTEGIEAMTARPATTRHGGALRWLAGVLLLGVLTACGSAETSGASGASGPEIRDVAATSGAFDNGGLAGPTSSAGASAAPAAGAWVEEQKLARTGTISLQVTDIGAATAKVRAINVAAEGITISENIGSYQPGTGNPERAVDPSTYAVLVISVPVAQLERTLDSLQAIGKVLDRRTETQNFTSEYVDVEARVSSMKKSVERIQNLIGATKDMDQLIRLEGELSSRQADLEAIQAQLAALDRQTARSTITVSLATEADLIGVTPTPRSGFVAGLKAGWNAFVASLVALFTLVGGILPFALVALLVGWPTLRVVRHRRANRARANGVTVAPTAGPLPWATAAQSPRASVPPPSGPQGAAPTAGASAEDVATAQPGSGPTTTAEGVAKAQPGSGPTTSADVSAPTPRGQTPPAE